MLKIEHFCAPRLPQRPYCTDCKNEGLVIRTLSTALKKKYIQFNPPHAIYWIVLDLDYPVMASDKMKEILAGELPRPNFLVENRNNGHAHAYYGLVTPVAKNENASSRALNYVAAIEAALIKGFGADSLYTNLIAKNPLNSHWILTNLRTDLYTLRDLHKNLELGGATKSAMRRTALKNAVVDGTARNCQIFEGLRKYAYQQLEEYKTKGSIEQWRQRIALKAKELNVFPIPLSATELRHISASIAQWTWTKYTGRLSDPEFSTVQAIRGASGGKKSAAIRATNAGEDFNEIMRGLGKLNGKGISAAQPWIKEGISRRQWYRDKKRHENPIETNPQEQSKYKQKSLPYKLFSRYADEGASPISSTPSDVKKKQIREDFTKLYDDDASIFCD